MNSPWRLFSLLIVLYLSTISVAQTETATVSGRVTDQQGALLVGAEVVIANIDTNFSSRQATNRDGLYVLSSLKPGRYRITVSAGGFRTVNLTDLVLNVQDSLSQNFRLQLGSVSESVTVVADEARVNTESAAVSTVVDRNFAENLPMNGRSFQTLIQLTPGVVSATSTAFDPGQFSVNGQRTNSNYWTVDGVGANIGSSASYAAGIAGALPSFSAQGGTNSLVSVDALQEFRIQTSTYAPEFGRTPGAQISILTRSGTNDLHGAAFDYLRNDKLDANDWFADNSGLPKPVERQNDFGGVFSGPILKNQAFFFFSYEGLRLRLPQVVQSSVPDLSARHSALPALQPYLDAFPLPNGLDDEATGVAQFNTSFSNSSTLDAYSLRIDDKANGKLALFGRYNYSPSAIVQRGFSGLSLSTVFPFKITTKTATVGATWLIAPTATNDLRFNYSNTNASSRGYLDSFGGAVPLRSLPFPEPYSDHNAFFEFGIDSLSSSTFLEGQFQHNEQRQVNVVDNLSIQKGVHDVKLGFDYRRLAPPHVPPEYFQIANFLDVPSAQTGSLLFSDLGAARPATFLFHNLSLFAQDTWRMGRMTLTYGIRWDVDFAPSTISGPSLVAVTGYNLNNLSGLALAARSSPPFTTPYNNIAPRIGAAYQLSHNPKWTTVLRGGLGIFYDLATQNVSDALQGSYPFGANQFNAGGTFPLGSSTAGPPSFAPPTATNQGLLYAFDPNLKLPYTLQWSVAAEQAVGEKQTVSVTYLGSAGRRLIQTVQIDAPNPSFGLVALVGNTAISDYNALQLQFQRRLSRGLQALTSYSWSHSIDTASANSFGSTSNLPSSAADRNANRGPSDFDVRVALSAGLTYDVPTPKGNAFSGVILRGWSVQNVIQVRTAPPVNVYDSRFTQLLNGFSTSIRPDVVPGKPLYLAGSQCVAISGGQCPGGRAFNPAAFVDPPTDPNTGLPLRQGNLGRNALRGFGATQWDFAVHRDFPIHERLKLQFRGELFNVLNHPNFGQPIGDTFSSQFGRSVQMFGQSLNSSNQGGGGFSPLYQVGGPRSIQLALKLQF